MKNMILIAVALLSAISLNLVAGAQSGGTFVMQKSAIIPSGGQSTGGTFIVKGTSGESVAGTTSTGGTFQMGGGFWGGPALEAAITISGRVFASDGLTGLRNASVSLTDPLGNVRIATTSSFGFYSFDNVAPGNVYTIRISSRRFRYQPQAVSPTGDLANVDFIGLE